MPDAYADDVVLLCNFNGADAATSYTPDRGPAVAFAGDAELDTGQKRWGSASLECPDTDDYIYLADPETFNFLHDRTSDYTIEAYCYLPSSEGGWRTLLSSITPVERGIDLRVSSSESVYFQVSRSGGSLTYNTASDVVTLDAWNYIKVIYDSSDNGLEVWVNGSQEIDTTLTGSAVAVDAGTLRIGDNPAIFDRGLKGWIDSIRITTVKRPGSEVPTEEFDLTVPVVPNECYLLIPHPLQPPTMIGRSYHYRILEAIDDGAGVRPKYSARIGTAVQEIVSFTVTRKANGPIQADCQFLVGYVETSASFIGQEITVYRTDVIGGVTLSTILATVTLQNARISGRGIGRLCRAIGYGSTPIGLADYPQERDTLRVFGSQSGATALRISPRVMYSLWPGDVVLVDGRDITIHAVTWKTVDGSLVMEVESR